MNWTNVKLIWLREVRDQLRDRRTIFTIAVLPLLLYPLIGMVFLQITQFMKEHPTRVWLIGVESLPAEPQLLDDGRFAAPFCDAETRALFELKMAAAMAESKSAAAIKQLAQTQIRDDVYDAVVYFPPDFAGRVAAFHQQLRNRESVADPASAELATERIPHPEIFYNSASDKSRISSTRLTDILRRWRKEMVSNSLRAHNIPANIVEPFEIVEVDVSREERRRAAVWSKILPFVVLIWALTGAFYPAVDLCAGEKERGTLETLLSSPAARIDIVWGKLFTVMTFSVATSLLNLACMGLTGGFIIQRLSHASEMAPGFDMRPPPLFAVVWLTLALIPIAALFSALALAVAAFARSSKEGQYYLMPLLLITLPLMMLPMLPTTELDFGRAVIPVTGMMLWLRALIEAQYADAVRFALPVIAVTLGCCWLSVRWAVAQFNSESVLFRESERVGLNIWLRHMVRDRGETPSVAEALLCGIVLLLLTFFASLQAAAPSDWSGFVRTALGTQIGLVAVPALIMAIILTRNPRETLLLRRPRLSTAALAFALAMCLHPSVVLLGIGIERVYPLSDEVARALHPLMNAMNEAPLIYVILLVGVTPAICEELAFRGFILSGLRNLGSRWAAIVISSLFFGLTHGMLQQSLAAFAIGIVIGFLAVQTRSLFPGMIFHFAHNSLSVLTGRIDIDLVEKVPLLKWLFQESSSDVVSFVYRWPVIVASFLSSAAILYWFRRQAAGSDGG